MEGSCVLLVPGGSQTPEQQLSQSNVALPQAWILIFHFQPPFLHKIKHPTATAPQNCQKTRDYVDFISHKWQTEVQGCLVFSGEQMYSLPLNT